MFGAHGESQCVPDRMSRVGTVPSLFGSDFATTEVPSVQSSQALSTVRSEEFFVLQLQSGLVGLKSLMLDCSLGFDSLLELVRATCKF
jgi:hypothetical protein